jgi:acyl-CoA reductase-like NAD-dependent aldehyde dehydrogenase
VYTIRDRLLRKGDYIHGSFLKPEVVDGYINGINPGDRSDMLGRFPFAEQDVDEAVECASEGASVWRRVPVPERAAALYRLREALLHLQENLAILITRENGKPFWEARQEVDATVRLLDVLMEDGVGLLASQVVDEVGARMDRIPRGAVAVITPYNLPLLVPVSHTAMALMAGNSVVLKPSKFTPGVGQAVADLWDRCRLPRGVFNMVQGSGAVVGQRLAVHPGIDMLLFTGSFETAMNVRRSIFDRPELPAIYQCGGKGIAIVLDDADLDHAVYEVLVGAFLTTGQRHNSTGRVIVAEGIYPRFVARLVEQARRLNVGYGFEQDIFMGPLVSENRRTRYRRYARALHGKGHEPLLDAGNERVEGYRGFYVSPAIFAVDWERSNPFLNEEPPGPTLLVYKVRDWQQAAALHNQAFYRPVASLFASATNPHVADVQERLRTGSLNFNRSTLGTYLRLPRMGLGRAGHGMPEGLQLLHLLSYPRASLAELRPFNPQTLLPGVDWNGDGRAVKVAVEAADEVDDLEDVSNQLESETDDRVK